MITGNDWLFRRQFIEENDQKNGRLYRSKSIWFIEDLGAAAKLERKVTSTASVYFHRFFLFHSFTTHDRFTVAVACIFLAAKVEESAIRLKDIVHKYYEVRHHGIFPDETTVREFHKKVILIERLVLNTLNFDLYVTHPNVYGKLKELKNFIPEENKLDVMQTAINFVNDSYRSTLCLQYTPNQIAIGMIYLTFVVLTIKPATRSPTEISWISLLEKEIDHITLRNICFEILDMYELITDKSLRIKDKNFMKDQIKSELGGDHEEIASFQQQSGSNDNLAVDSLSPSRLTDQETYEEENDTFSYDDYNRMNHSTPKITVSHHHLSQRSISQSKETPPVGFCPGSAAAADTPNGSESVQSSMSVPHNVVYHYGGQEETPHLPPPPDTPVGNYNNNSQSSDVDPDQTPTFQSLQRLPVRERSHSISDNSSYHESNKRQKLI